MFLWDEVIKNSNAKGKNTININIEWDEYTPKNENRIVLNIKIIKGEPEGNGIQSNTYPVFFAEFIRFK